MLRFDITSKSVKNLVLSTYADPLNMCHLDDIIEINAPNILSLEIEGDLLLWNVLLELKIGGFFSKVLSRLEAKCFVIPSNLKFISDPSGSYSGLLGLLFELRDS
ncbi:hypothetical protein L2E82_39919 [Cichorium intybus]|uniref:Uncharacterized protein n=1 Tax=Cichorium intybus TaxID=13427 RepID=A0ACB9AKJ2_CICIN|nr:hypothetical protein L2E82_39919 [Cichorium intybus]